MPLRLGDWEAQAHPRHLRLLPRQRRRLVRDGEIVAAAQEERFTRKKHDAGFPAHAVAYCLHGRRHHGRGPRLRRLLRQAAPQVRAAPGDLPRHRAAGASAVPDGRCRSGSRRSCSPSGRSGASSGFDGAMLFTEHHESHAASAFFPSPFEEAAILTIDGVGEWATAIVRRRASGERHRAAAGAALPALARPALLRLHLLHRLQGQLGRVQADGAGALRRAEVRRR